MMMDCPRCGFNQPKDRFCASCGLDVDQFLAKPKPLWLRVLQNPNLHLSLIGLLIVLATGYIFYSRGERVGRETGGRAGLPLSSKDSRGFEPADAAPEFAKAASPEELPVTDEAGSGDRPVEAELDAAAKPAMATSVPVPPAAPEVQKIEVAAWEVPRETLSTLIIDADRLNEAGEGRAYQWAQGAKISDVLQASARRLGLGRTMALQPGAQAIMETPPSVPEAFHFGFLAELTKIEGKDFLVRWQGGWVLTGPVENVPAAVVNLSGNATLAPHSVVLIVLDPTTRTVREDLLARAGEGPWSIFSSEAFRGGVTDWVIQVQAK